MIKMPKETRIAKSILNILKAVYDKPMAKIILNEGKLKVFSLQSGRDKGVHYLHY
jgi:hypothetical protein